MSNFRTEIKPTHYPFNINHKDNIYLMGSCFAQNIQGKLDYYKYDTKLNSQGILFDPIFVCNAIDNLFSNKKYSQEDLFFHQERWHSYEHHSCFSNTNVDKVLDSINENISVHSAHLSLSKTLIITLGTAYVYQLKENNKSAGNCHKAPQSNFNKRLLSVDEIINRCSLTIEKLKKNLPNLNVIWTVSPVRHIKEGIIENQQSKSTLLLAIHALVDKHESCYYFPSYEIMMDDLRDYRFYKRDMIHPNSLAVDYIWSKFSGSLITPYDIELLNEIDQINRDLAHRPFNSESEAHSKFEKSILKKKESLLKNYPYLKSRL